MVIKTPSPLIYNVPIVRANGTPTNEFMRLWNQQAAINIDVATVTTAITNLEIAVADLENDVEDIQDVDVVAGTGLTGGGNIAGPTDVTLDLEDTAVTPGTYGDDTNSARITVDQQGRITAVTEEPISGGGGGSSESPWEFVEEVTASAAAYLDIPLPDSDTIKIIIKTIPANDGVTPYFRVTTDSFSTVKSGSSAYQWSVMRTRNGSTNEAGTNSTSLIELGQTGMGNDGTFDSVMEVYNANDSGQETIIKHSGIIKDTGPGYNLNQGFGAFIASTDVVDGLRFYYSAGNVGTARVQVYKLKEP